MLAVFVVILVFVVSVVLVVILVFVVSVAIVVLLAWRCLELSDG